MRRKGKTAIRLRQREGYVQYGQPSTLDIIKLADKQLHDDNLTALGNSLFDEVSDKDLYGEWLLHNSQNQRTCACVKHCACKEEQLW
ncbi:MAG: hypothetical protein V3S69_03215 [Dehalococcoidales bacterium]